MVVALIALLATTAASGGAGAMERIRTHQQQASLTQLFMLARASAVFSHQPVTIDRSAGVWTLTDSQGAALQRVNAPHAQWRGFRQLPLVFTPDGGASNGSLWICVPPYAAPRGLTLSRAGRLRRSLDSNHDGIHETGQGRAIDCSR